MTSAKLARSRAPLAAALAWAFAAVLALAAGSALAQAEGREFTRLKNPQPVETGKKIEVIEFFSYGCPHCGELEPFLQAWLKKLPPDVQFRRVPVAFNPSWENLSKVYYTLDALGEEQRLSPEIFVAIHNQGAKFTQDKVFFDWAASKGLDRKKVEDTFGSFAIGSKQSRAKQLAQAYNIQSVPTIIVDGKFVTSSSAAGTHAQVPAILDALIAKARAERPKG